MDLRLQITQKEGASISSLVKQMCALKCRIKVDTAKGNISIEEMDDNSVENVIDAIDEAFNIVGIDIIPTVEIPEPEKPVVTAESLEIAKIEFSNKEVEEQANKLMRVIYWAMYSNKANSRDICQYLMSAGTEIAMKYNPNELLNFSVGDVVACNFGTHLNGEVSGGYVHAIVCDIEEDGTFYAAPITKVKAESDYQKYLQFEADLDVDYNNPKYAGGTVLLKKGGYIRPERIREIVGKTQPEFFAKLLEILPETVRFSHNVFEENNSANEIEIDNSIADDGPDEHSEGKSAGEGRGPTTEKNAGEGRGPTTEKNADEGRGPATEKSAGEYTEENLSITSSEGKNEGNSLVNGKKPTVEAYVAELFAGVLSSLEHSNVLEEQVEMFLNGIGFQTNNDIIKQSFMHACEVKKIVYESIILELHKDNHTMNDESIKATMKEEFKKWLEQYPELKERYPKISFITLLKVFSRKIG